MLLATLSAKFIIWLLLCSLMIVLNMILDAAVEDRLLDRNPLKSTRLKITGEASKVTEPYTREEMRHMGPP